jgi:hypothetical protein
MNDNQKKCFIINYIFNENLCIFLPAVVKDVLGVDERNNMPLTLHFDDFGSIGFDDGCKERFLRFFDDDE